MFPSKVVKIRDSILWNLPDIVSIIESKNNLVDAYSSSINKKIDINDFLLSIDILYLLDMIEIVDEKGNYKYVKSN